jgi:uncharacterized protein
MKPTADDLIRLYNLQPLPVEGGLFRQTWRARTAIVHPETGRSGPAGTAIMMLLNNDPDCFSALHRLPTDEIWHFYMGDPVDLLLLAPHGTILQIVLGQDVLAGEQIQMMVPAGTWMGARLRAGGGYALFGCTMAPGFTEADYEGGTETLTEQYPAAAATILALIRRDTPTTMETEELPT